MKSDHKYALLIATCAFLSVAVIGCSTLNPVSQGATLIGSDQSAVERSFGKPTDVYHFSDGTTRWFYSTQPAGYQSYAADFDSNGKLLNFRQTLVEKELYKAKVGVWTRADVEQSFGRPREAIKNYSIEKIEVWSYRVFLNGAQPGHFYFYFDDKGVLRSTDVDVDILY